MPITVPHSKLAMESHLDWVDLALNFNETQPDPVVQVQPFAEGAPRGGTRIVASDAASIRLPRALVGSVISLAGMKSDEKKAYVALSVDLDNDVEITITAVDESGAIAPEGDKSYAELILEAEPAAYYRMGDSSETTVLDDSSGNGRIGSRFGATTGAASLIPNDPQNAAMSFDGSNDWCEVNALQDLSDEFEAAGITVEFWCTYSDPHETYAVLALNGVSIANVVHFNVAQTPRVFLDGESHDGSIITDDGVPHHVVITYTPGGQIHLFVDGVEDTAGEFPVTGGDIRFNATATTWSIGQEFDGSNTSNHYEGVLDELAVYVGPRSPATILEHYQKGMTPASVERSHVAGSVQIDGDGYARDVVVLADTPFGRRVIAEGKSQGNGDFDIEYEQWGGPVLAIALDTYGQDFQASKALNQGSRVHPSTPDGYVYQVTAAGTTGESEPEWNSAGTTQSGSVTFQAVPFYRPVASGPLKGEPIA